MVFILSIKKFVTCQLLICIGVALTEPLIKNLTSISKHGRPSLKLYLEVDFNEDKRNQECESAKLKFEIHSEQEIHIEGRKMTLVEGISLHLECKIDCQLNQTSNIRIAKLNDWLENHIENQSSLYLGNVKPEHNGRYICYNEADDDDKLLFQYIDVHVETEAIEQSASLDQTNQTSSSVNRKPIDNIKIHFYLSDYSVLKCEAKSIQFENDHSGDFIRISELKKINNIVFNIHLNESSSQPYSSFKLLSPINNGIFMCTVSVRNTTSSYYLLIRNGRARNLSTYNFFSDFPMYSVERVDLHEYSPSAQPESRVEDEEEIKNITENQREIVFHDINDERGVSTHVNDQMDSAKHDEAEPEFEKTTLHSEDLEMRNEKATQLGLKTYPAEPEMIMLKVSHKEHRDNEYPESNEVTAISQEESSISLEEPFTSEKQLSTSEDTPSSNLTRSTMISEDEEVPRLENQNLENKYQSTDSHDDGTEKEEIFWPRKIIFSRLIEVNGDETIQADEDEYLEIVCLLPEELSLTTQIYIWNRSDNKELDENIIIEDNRMKISKFQRSNAGKYTCYNGNKSFTIDLKVQSDEPLTTKEWTRTLNTNEATHLRELLMDQNEAETTVTATEPSSLPPDFIEIENEITHMKSNQEVRIVVSTSTIATREEANAIKIEFGYKIERQFITLTCSIANGIQVEYIEIRKRNGRIVSAIENSHILQIRLRKWQLADEHMLYCSVQDGFTTQEEVISLNI